MIPLTTMSSFRKVAVRTLANSRWWLPGLLLAGPALAEVNVLSQMRLGELDPGPQTGRVGASLDSVDDVRGVIAVSDSGLQYSGSTGVGGSSVCFDCSGGGATGSVVLVPSDNWGIEAWVSGDSGAVTGVIAYNGDSASRGMGLYSHEGAWRGLVGGVAFVGSAAITAQWTHLAIVVQGGTTTFYVNGAAVATGPAPVPPVSGDALNIGNRRDRAEPLDGRVDEVRIFTFAPGAFSPADLQTARVRPAPAVTRIPAPLAPGAHQGTIAVALETGGGWRLAGEKEWRAGGSAAGGLGEAPWQIEYRPVPGFTQPASETVSVPNGGASAVLPRTYTASDPGTGVLTVHLLPGSLSAPTVPAGQRPQWRLHGDNGSVWMASGASLVNLKPGRYLVECSAVPGKQTPPLLNAQVFDGEPAVVSATYSAALSGGGAGMVPLAFSVVNSSTEFPLGCLGQLRSDTTTGTGFSVRPTVVATAGDVVFDEAALSGVTGLQWLPRRDRGVHEPKPVIPRGVLLLSGYAAQRAAEQTPGVVSTTSAGLSAAALFFVASGDQGNAGEFPTITPQDSLLPATALKFFAGYPGEIPGVTGFIPGRMHAHYALPVTFTQVSGRTYTTAGFTGMPGASGSPLFVQLPDGSWHPAAMLAGGTSVTTVCAIDAEVSRLFNTARDGSSVISNPNGGYSMSNSVLPGASSTVAALQVVLEPAGLTTAASWMIQDMIPRRSGQRLLNLSPGNYTIRLSALPGMSAPGNLNPDGSSNIAVSLTGGQLSVVTAAYAGISSHPVSRQAAPGAAVTFSVGTFGSPESWQWRFNGAPIPGATASSLTKNPVSAADAGIYAVTVGFGFAAGGSPLVAESREAALLVGGNGPLPAWRLAWFGTSASSGSAADGADPDRDGRTNLEEYAALTNPNDGSSYFHASAVTDGTGLRIRFTAKAGRSYRLEANSSLSGQWQTLQTRAAAATDAEADWLIGVTETRRFLRVRAVVN